MPTLLVNEEAGVDIDDDVITEAEVEAEVDANVEADDNDDVSEVEGVDERCCKPGTLGIWGPSGSKCTGKPLNMALITFSTSTKRSKSKSITLLNVSLGVCMMKVMIEGE